MTESELTAKEHDKNIAEAEKSLAETKAAAADAKFPKFPDVDLIKEHAENVAEAERTLAQAKAAAVFAKPTEAHATVKEHEAKVAEAEKALAEAKAAAAHEEFPKWIEPDPSHIHKSDQTGHVSVPLFPDHHIDHNGVVTVLVHDAEQEEKALAAAVSPTANDNAASKEVVS